MDAGVLSFSTTLRSYFQKDGRKVIDDSTSNRPSHELADSTHSEALADLSTPSNSWQASVYPSSASAVDTTLNCEALLPRVSFDDFLESGHAVDEFEWDLDAAQRLTFADIRDWRSAALGLDEISEKLEDMVVERRTKLWRIILAQQRHDRLDTPFTAPTTLETRPEPYKLEPTDHGTHWRVPLQRIHISPFAIPSELAAVQPHGAASLLDELNDIFGTRVEMESSLELWLRSRVEAKLDLGYVYAYLRPWWRGWLASRGSFASVLTQMNRRREEDSRLRSEAAEPDANAAGGRSIGASPRVINTCVPPRRVWDLYSNRVLPFCALPSSSIPENLWAVSHCWVAETDRSDILTPINGFQWPVPLPIRTTLDRIRIELLNLGAEYVFLDVLCLRQYSDEESERLRGYEWRLDVPTLGYVFRHERYQTVVVYFNGLGKPFDIRRPVLGSRLHWFKRAWTLQETAVNWLPGGLRASIPGQTEGLYFMSSMRESQYALEIPTRSLPSFATLLRGMYNRSGCADKKPYDRVAALMYLLPSSKPAVYSKRWSSAEDAWTTLVEGLTGRERLALLMWQCPETRHAVSEMAHASRIHWRPSWDEVMAYPHLAPEPNDCPYTDDEGLEGPILFEWQRFYYHFAYVFEDCRTAGKGFIIIPSGGDDDDSSLSGSIKDAENIGHSCRHIALPFHLESSLDTSDTISLTLVGFGGLERWVVGMKDGSVDLGAGRTASRLRKCAVGRMTDPVERTKVQEFMQLGCQRWVAYLDP